MNKGVMGPLLITGVVVAVGNGWILAAWTTIYNWTHGGAAAAVNKTPPVTIGDAGKQTSSGGITTTVLPRIRG